MNPVECERTGVLLVDDHPARLLSYEAILGGLGFDLVRAESGTAALARLMEREFAAILLDVNMPGMDGFETASLIHRHPRFEKTPIIFVTAVHVTDLDRLKGYQLGAVDYVYVPVVPEILRGKVAVLAELYRQRKALERLNRDLARTNAELARAHSSLQAERAAELAAMNATLERANAELAESNAGLLREIGERKRIEAALHETDRRKDAFLATLSHELRNPLAAIANAVRLLQVVPGGDPRANASRDVLGRQVAHLIRLIDDLLDVSRIRTGKILLRTERVELAGLVAQALEAARPLLAERGQRLDVRLPAAELLLDADPVRITQVVSNLLANAIKFTPEGGHIELAAEAATAPDGAAAEAVITIRDDGIGIDAELLPEVFDLFSQGEHDEGRAGGGLGIGLALVRELVALHGGTVAAASAGPGRGAEFTVRLPLAAPAAPALPDAASRSGRTGSRPSAAQHRVLVVDDNRDSADSLAALLRLLGHEAIQAYDGRGAIDAAVRLAPDLVLLDIGMPGMNGYDVARELRAVPQLARAMLIALTGYGSAEDRRRSLEAGFDGHLVKPIDFDGLERVLAALPDRLAPPRHPEAA